jgi:hypothetical protein
VTKQKATCTKDFLGENVAQSPQIWEFFYFFFLSGWPVTKLVKNMIKKKKGGDLAERKGKEKKIIMLYLVTTKLNT